MKSLIWPHVSRQRLRLMLILHAKRRTGSSCWTFCVVVMLASAGGKDFDSGILRTSHVTS